MTANAIHACSPGLYVKARSRLCLSFASSRSSHLMRSLCSGVMSFLPIHSLGFTAKRLLAPAKDTFHAPVLIDFLPFRPLMAIPTGGAISAIHKPRLDARLIARVNFYVIAALDRAYHLFVGKSFRNPKHDSVGFQTRQIGQICGDIFNSAYDDLPRPALVSILPTPGRPYAIIGRVWPVIVDTLDRMLRGPFSHVFYKGMKAIPALAYSNSATAVVGVIRNVRAEAPITHIGPGSVKRVRVLEGHVSLLAKPLPSNLSGVN